MHQINARIVPNAISFAAQPNHTIHYPFFGSQKKGKKRKRSFIQFARFAIHVPLSPLHKKEKSKRHEKSNKKYMLYI